MEAYNIEYYTQFDTQIKQYEFFISCNLLWKIFELLQIFTIY